MKNYMRYLVMMALGLSMMMPLKSLGADDMTEEWIIYETIAREATTGSMDDYVAVARTIRERKALGWWGDTFREVVLSPFQFSCWNKNIEQDERSEDQISMAKLAWSLSRTETEFRPTHYVLTTDVDDTYWTGAENMKYLCSVGLHSYYRERR